MPDWFLKPHPRYGTTYRILYLILGLQLFTIVVSRGDVLLLGEAYAFGVVWSFVFKALAMVVLRFKDPRPREYKVPLNIRIGKYEVPIGLMLIFLVLLVTAVANLLTKETGHHRRPDLHGRLLRPSSGSRSTTTRRRRTGRKASRTWSSSTRRPRRRLRRPASA